MQRQGCRPDVVTVTALIQAFERGGQWRRALAVSHGNGAQQRRGRQPARLASYVCVLACQTAAPLNLHTLLSPLSAGL